jgi:PadR family transcriptional regulator, regulatory protein PadR
VAASFTRSCGEVILPGFKLSRSSVASRSVTPRHATSLSIGGKAVARAQPPRARSIPSSARLTTCWIAESQPQAALVILLDVPQRKTDEAVAEAVPLTAARTSAASGGGPGANDPLVGELRRAGLLPLLVLHLLASGPSYGNALIEGISISTGGLISVNPNTMYPLLRALEESEFVTGEWEHPERRSRRFYAITEQGELERQRLAAEIKPRLEEVASALELLRRVL